MDSTTCPDLFFWVTNKTLQLLRDGIAFSLHYQSIEPQQPKAKPILYIPNYWVELYPIQNSIKCVYLSGYNSFSLI